MRGAAAQSTAAMKNNDVFSLYENGPAHSAPEMEQRDRRARRTGAGLQGFSARACKGH